MTSIFLASVTPYVGKNVVAVGLIEELRRAKKSVGIFKPLGPLPAHVDGAVADEDALFFKKTFNLPEPLEALCPVVLTDQALSQALRGNFKDARDRILGAYQTVAQGKDVVLSVGMGRLSSGLTLGYGMDRFVRDTQARILCVARYQWPTESLDGILHMKELLPEHFAGVVFNRVPPSRVSQVEQAVRPFLKTHGIEVLCVLPEDTILNAVPIAEIIRALNGKVLCAGNNLDQLVEHFSIGAMNVEAAVPFFQRVPHKAVITGGDRADIQLAALQTSTRCLLLTGDLYPNERILVRAEELGVPVVLVSQDTSATIAACERLQGHLTLNSAHKVARARDLIGKGMNWELLKKQTGL